MVTTWLPTREKPEIGRFVANDIEMLSRDHDVQVVHLAAGEAALPLGDGVTVTHVSMSPSDPLSIWKSAQVIAQLVPAFDVVHTMAVSALLPFVFGRPVRPWVHTEHWSALLSPSSTGIAARVAIPWVARLLVKPDVVVAVGQQLAAAIGRRRKQPTVVIPNGVDRPDVLHERPGEAELTLVGVGGLIPRKGPDVAIRAIAELRRRGIGARLIWAGDGPMRDELEQLAEELGIGAHVDLRGRVDPRHIGDLLAESHVFVLPTRVETFGVAIAEALVAGRPVVVGAEGEQASFVTEPDGVLVHEWTGTAYADGVERAMTLNAHRSSAEIAASARARFDNDSRRVAYTAVYAQAGAHRRVADIDVVIAVHDPRRRIDRAVQSVLTSEDVARVIVVCHGVTAESVEASVGLNDPRIEYVAFSDGIRSPAGPFNHGLDIATARFVAILGSDDELTPGALDGWRRTAELKRAQVVIAPLRHAGGARVPTPPTMRRQDLKGRRDRLAYRTAPLGLLEREFVGDLRLTPDMATGEDLAFTLRLWFGLARVTRHTEAGEYLIHDGDDRVTFTHRALSEELSAVAHLIQEKWFRALPEADRVAIAVKLWRINLFGAVHYRAGEWTTDDRTWCSELIRQLRDVAPAALHRLSKADVALVDGLADPAVPDGEVDVMSRRRRRFFSLQALLPARLWLLFAREAPVPYMAATWWAGRR